MLSKIDSGKNKNMFNKVKSAYQFVKDYPKLSLFILILLALLVRVVNQNYSFQNPVVNKRAESYQTVWNERAALLQQVEELKTARDNANSDIVGEVK